MSSAVSIDRVDLCDPSLFKVAGGSILLSALACGCKGDVGSAFWLASLVKLSFVGVFATSSISITSLDICSDFSGVNVVTDGRGVVGVDGSSRRVCSIAFGVALTA
jgi:hypothetical protein